MELTIRPAGPAHLADMETWRYDPPYDFYDGDEDPVLDPERYFAALGADGALVGFFYFDDRADELEIGLGLRPDLVGRGLGLDFVQAGVELGRERFRPARVVLAVAAFNERAIRVYERAGFRETGRHVRTFERWGEVEFVDMEEDA